MPGTKKQLVTLEEFDTGGAVLGDCKHAERNAIGSCKSCGDQVYTFDEWQDLRRKADELGMLFNGYDVDDIEKEIAGWRKALTEAFAARRADAIEHKKHIVALTDQLAIEHTAAALARKMAHCLVDIGSSSGV